VQKIGKIKSLINAIAFMRLFSFRVLYSIYFYISGSSRLFLSSYDLDHYICCVALFGLVNSACLKH